MTHCELDRLSFVKRSCQTPAINFQTSRPVWVAFNELLFLLYVLLICFNEPHQRGVAVPFVSVVHCPELDRESRGSAERKGQPSGHGPCPHDGECCVFTSVPVCDLRYLLWPRSIDNVL